MMLKEKIAEDFKQALKSGDAFRRSLLGMLKAAIQNKEIAQSKKEAGLNEIEMMEVIKTEMKKRLDAAAAFKNAGDAEKARSEEAEADILKTYLPPEASESDIKMAVEKAMAEIGSKSKKNFGQIMGLAMKELGLSADGHKVKQILDAILE
jgi:uncharacterized protein YqeY